MSAAAVVYRKKSYHSTAVPMKLAAATFQMFVCWACSGAWAALGTVTVFPLS